MDEIGVVTVGERATRVILCAVGLFFGGVAVGWAGAIAAVTAWSLVVVGAVALAQLTVSVRRSLTAAPH
jgi:hypothetical protein